ncbi:MAG: SDR family oxidoreductase [Firmicutes bacterium]|nr:SDR family oxidoreductase [Bacillota bacterium]
MTEDSGFKAGQAGAGPAGSGEGQAGRWALILGASSGFGEAAAKALARAGMNICGVHLDRKAGLAHVEEIRAEITAAGVRAVFFNVNAADSAKQEEVLAALAGPDFSAPPSGPKVGVVLHSLAFGSLKPFLAEAGADATTKAQLEMTLDVMANSLVYWVQGLVAHGLIGRGSRIYAMTSSGGHRVWKTYGAVSAAKAALESHCRQLALELAPLGATVNAIRAGVTDTPALRKIPGHEEMVAEARRRNPHGRLTTPEDVAAAIVALSGAGTHWITGNVIGVDGGEDIVG